MQEIVCYMYNKLRAHLKRLKKRKKFDYSYSNYVNFSCCNYINFSCLKFDKNPTGNESLRVF